MKRKIKRAGSLLLFLALGGWLIYLGDRWLIDGIIPVKYVGYILVVFAAFGLCGFNVWKGGPLDPKHDTDEEDHKNDTEGGKPGPW